LLVLASYPFFFLIIENGPYWLVRLSVFPLFLSIALAKFEREDAVNLEREHYSEAMDIN